jgi:hypothetical protein
MCRLRRILAHILLFGRWRSMSSLAYDEALLTCLSISSLLTYPAPSAKQPPHELSSVSISIHSKPTLNQSAREFRLLSRAAAEAGVTWSRECDGMGQATDPPGQRKDE